MHTIRDYRAFKYEKYTTPQEGKLFYRHEKNLDLVNTVAELVHTMQEGNPRKDLTGLEELKSKVGHLPQSIQSSILPKIHWISFPAVFAHHRNNEILREIDYKNNTKIYLQKLAIIEDHVIQDLSDDILCFAHGGVNVFFLQQEDWDVLINYEKINNNTRGFFMNSSIFLKQEYMDDPQKSENIYNHEYQHYLFNRLKPNNRGGIHNDVIDELCATLISHSHFTIFEMAERICGYYKDFIKNHQYWKEMEDEGRLRMLHIGPTVSYILQAYELIDLFQKNSQFGIDRQKAIRILSMTSPHYREDLLQYYTKLAKYLAEKTSSMSE